MLVPPGRSSPFGTFNSIPRGRPSVWPGLSTYKPETRIAYDLPTQVRVASSLPVPVAIFSAPQRGLARLILRIRSMTSLDTQGRPRGWRLLKLQYSRNPLRCQAMTVSGLTITRTALQPLHSRESQTHRSRSAALRCTYENGSSAAGQATDAGELGSPLGARLEFGVLAESKKTARE